MFCVVLDGGDLAWDECTPYQSLIILSSDFMKERTLPVAVPYTDSKVILSSCVTGFLRLLATYSA